MNSTFQKPLWKSENLQDSVSNVKFKLICLLDAFNLRAVLQSYFLPIYEGLWEFGDD